MNKETWEGIPKSVRDAVIAAFRMAGIDFEGEHIVSESKGGIGKVESPWLTRAEAAEYAKCSTDTVDNWIAKKYIQRAKMNDAKPGGVLIDRASLDKFIRSKLINPKKRDREMAPSVQGGYRVSAGKRSTKGPAA